MTAPNMTCRELVDFLLEYQSDELPSEQRAVFDAHLGECPPCLAYMKSYGQTVQLGRDACQDGDEIPGDCPEALVNAILAARAASN